MTETELIIAWSEVSGHLWTVLQFWASISFGMIAVAHFASEQLNRLLVVLLTVLYVLFSLYCAGFYISDVELLMALYEEAQLSLEERNGKGVFLSAFVHYPPVKLSALFGVVGFPTIFLGSIFYLLYRYKSVNKGGERGSS